MQDDAIAQAYGEDLHFPFFLKGCQPKRCTSPTRVDLGSMVRTWVLQGTRRDHGSWQCTVCADLTA